MNNVLCDMFMPMVHELVWFTLIWDNIDSFISQHHANTNPVCDLNLNAEVGTFVLMIYRYLWYLFDLLQAHPQSGVYLAKRVNVNITVHTLFIY